MSTWTIRRVGDMARLINGHPFDSGDFTPTGDVPLVRIRDITAADFETYVPQHTVPQGKVLKDGDVVIGMDGDFNVILWRRGTAALNQRVCALRDTGVSDLRFLAYALPEHLKVINDLTYSTTVKHLSSGQATGLRITAPDRDGQGRIADYLDRETTTIDALIEKQRDLKDLLVYRRRAVIEHCATFGLRARDLVPSTSRWIQNVPTGWEVKPLKFLAKSYAGATPDSDNVAYWDYEGAEGLPWVAIGDMTGTRMVRTTKRRLTPEGVASKKLSVGKPGTVLFAMYASVGAVAQLDVESAWNQAILGLVPFSGAIEPGFLYYALCALKPRLPNFYRSNTQHNLNAEQVGNLDIAVPPVEEQREIADHLDRETAKIDTLIAKAERFIELAQERRAALITAAVTGQIEIPTED